MANVISNLPKPGEQVKYVDVVTSGGKDRLAVEAQFSGSITIGDVSIKDPVSGLQAEVITGEQGKDGLVVVTEDFPKSKVVIYGTSLVAPSGNVILATYTVPVLKKFFYTGAIIGGACEGEFSFLISGSPIAKARNSGSNRTIILKFPEEPEASAGAVISIPVTNIGDLNKTYEATIFGYTVDA